MGYSGIGSGTGYGMHKSTDSNFFGRQSSWSIELVIVTKNLEWKSLETSSSEMDGWLMALQNADLRRTPMIIAALLRVSIRSRYLIGPHKVQFAGLRCLRRRRMGSYRRGSIVKRVPKS